MMHYNYFANDDLDKVVVVVAAVVEVVDYYSYWQQHSSILNYWSHTRCCHQINFN